MDFLLGQPLVVLLAVLAGGFFLGEIRFPGGIRFGVAMVLFVGLAAGAWGVPAVVPPVVESLGLALFVYCLGLQAAPGFLGALRRDGVVLTPVTVVGIALVALAVALIGRWTGVDSASVSGLFAGISTNNASLGAALELARAAGLGESVQAKVTVSAALLYAPSVLATLLVLHVLVRTMPAAAATSSEGPALPAGESFRVTTLDPDGRPWTVATLREAVGVVLSRHRAPGEPARLATPDHALPPGTIVVAVGTAAQHARMVAIAGPVEREEPLHERFEGFAIRRFFVSNREIAGRTLGELRLETLGAVATRVRRGDIELPVTADLQLNLGDRVRVLLLPQREREIAKLLGNSLAVSTETGTLSFLVGLIGGCLLGLVPLPIPGVDLPLRLGSAGGALVAALILGRVGRTGPFVWQLPLTVNLTLRQFGIGLFLAGAGLKAGVAVRAGLPPEWPLLLGGGIAILVAVHALVVLALRLFGRCDRAVVLGVLCAFQTQPAALAFAQRHEPGGALLAAYAAVYPVAFILKLAVAQWLLG